jgi:hypothetical protein
MSTENQDSSPHWVGAQQDFTLNMKVLIEAADRDLQSKYASSGGHRDVRLTTELPCKAWCRKSCWLKRSNTWNA